MIADKDIYEDRFSTLEAGMNSNPVYSLLPKNQASLLINTTCRNGIPQCRPGWKPVALTFPDEEIETPFRTGNFQGAFFYESDNVNSIVTAISGRLYRIRMDNFQVTDITVPGNPNSSILPLSWFVQAEEFLVVQDGQSKPIIYNGAVSRRAGPNEVPTGTAMAYGMGRLWVANGRTYTAGDIVGGPGGTSVLTFTENTYIAGGGSFSVPLQSGNITAMSFIANLNTPLGQGALIVFTEEGAFSVQVPVERTEWATTTNPIATVAQMEFGSISSHITAVNGDLFYRSQDGIRSLVVAVRNYGQWGNVPISSEMTTPLSQDDEFLASYASSVLFDNRLLMTSTPQKTPRGTAFLGLIALDFDLVSSLRQTLPPAYDGIWVGLKWLQVLRAKKPARCYGFVVNEDDEIDLWEITKKERFDSTDQPIRWIMEGPGLNFGNPTELKRLFYGDIWIDRIAGNVDFLVSYRPDHYPFFVDWSTFSRCGNYQDCDILPACKTFSEPKEQYRPRIRLPIVPEGCEPATNKPFHDIYETQIRLQMTGFCRILSTRIFARRLQEPAVGSCPGVEACVTESGCDKNPYAYSSE